MPVPLSYLPVSLENVGPRDHDVDLRRPRTDGIPDLGHALLQRDLPRGESRCYRRDWQGTLQLPQGTDGIRDPRRVDADGTDRDVVPLDAESLDQVLKAGMSLLCRSHLVRLSSSFSSSLSCLRLAASDEKLDESLGPRPAASYEKLALINNHRVIIAPDVVCYLSKLYSLITSKCRPEYTSENIRHISKNIIGTI